MIATEVQGSKRVLSNSEIAALLDETADLLEEQQANPFRLRAYRRAAEVIRRWPGEVRQVARVEGTSGLERLPGVGRSIARTIEQLVRSGHFPLLDRLRAQDYPERVLTTVADIGPTLARRIHEQLGISSLNELEAAAYDGRLDGVPGMGRKRLRAVRECLAGRFAGRRWQMPRQPAADDWTEVSELLDVDRQYRQQASDHRLPQIAPRRFNPTGVAWLPILRTRRGTREYTALFSNTARAHDLGTTHDWVVIRGQDNGRTGSWTVVTARFGPLRGRRVVRGHESECEDYYRSLEEPESQQSPEA